MVPSRSCRNYAEPRGDGVFYFRQIRGFSIGKLNSIKTLGDPLVDGFRSLLLFRNRPGPRRSMLHPAGDHNFAFAALLVFAAVTLAWQRSDMMSLLPMMPTQSHWLEPT